MKKNFHYENIKGLHLELTTKCNAMCPMCNRNFKGKIREKLPIIELSLNDIKKILPLNFIKQLNLISLCGVYGEPICNTELKSIVKYLYECNPKIDIDIYTNGSLHDVKWWEEFADIIGKHKGTVIFGIDGIGDVHSLHRCNTNYNKIIENAQAFINNNGVAQWDFIVFKHNEHQIEEVKEISKALGFKKFQIKKTSRFFKNLYENDGNLDSTCASYGKHPVFNDKGKIKYYIELPNNCDYRNASEEKIFELIDNYGSFNNYLDKNDIECDAIKNGGIFISANGEVFPCCTMYQQICYKTIHGVNDESELNEYNLYINDNLSAFDRTINEIVNDCFFKNLCKSFKCESISKGKPKSCSRACGNNLNVHSSGHTSKIKYRRD